MNHQMKISLLPILIILILLNPTHTTAQIQSASKSGEIDIIKENVKKRLLNRVQGSNSADKPSAITGILSSIANETLTLETDTGMKLASTSAFTRFQNAKDSSQAKAEDLAIDNYLVVIGDVNATQVVDADTIIVHEKKPEITTTQTEFGLLTSYDPRSRIVTIVNPYSQRSVTGTLDRKAKFFEVTPEFKNQASDTKALIVNQSNVLVIYTQDSVKDSNTITSVLIKNDPTAVDETTEDESNLNENNLPPEIQQ